MVVKNHQLVGLIYLCKYYYKDGGDGQAHFIIELMAINTARKLPP